MNKKFVYQVGNNKKVILWCMANQIYLKKKPTNKQTNKQTNKIMSYSKEQPLDDKMTWNSYGR